MPNERNEWRCGKREQYAGEYSDSSKSRHGARVPATASVRLVKPMLADGEPHHRRHHQQSCQKCGDERDSENCDSKHPSADQGLAAAGASDDLLSLASEAMSRRNSVPFIALFVPLTCAVAEASLRKTLSDLIWHASRP